MTIINPADDVEARLAVMAAAEMDGDPHDILLAHAEIFRERKQDGLGAVVGQGCVCAQLTRAGKIFIHVLFFLSVYRNGSDPGGIPESFVTGDSYRKYTMYTGKEQFSGRT